MERANERESNDAACSRRFLRRSYPGVHIAFAQQQRSAVEGTVRDSSGGVIAGAKWTARGSALVREVSGVTDALGRYRFPAVPPGTYEIAASASGLVMKAAATATLGLGELLTIDLTLVPPA